MKHETFLKLLQGTLEDIQIACNWLVKHHNPIEYITKHSNTKNVSPIGSKSLKFKDIDDNVLFLTGTGRLYYKYSDERVIIVSKYAITVTDGVYNSSLPLINH